MSLKDMYFKVYDLISDIDFSKLWHDFKPIKFALYNNDECFFDGEYIEKTDKFIGNTSIDYNGEIIAIWNLNEKIDEIVLASKIIHEMFHGFQTFNKDPRFANEPDALYEYKYTNKNLSIKFEENKLIYELVQNFNINKLNTLLGLRKNRSSKYSYEFLYESRVEQIEGTANYIELHVLKQLSKELYNKKLERMLVNITTPNNLLPIRVISYDIGALLLHVLKENNIKFDEGFSHYTFSEDLIKNASEVSYTNELFMEGVISSFLNNADRIITKAVQLNDIVENQSQRLLGLNVYDAIFHNGYIISKYFVIYGQEHNPTIKYGNFVIESKEKGVLTKIYKY